ncbi:hypothetical protein ORJ04_23055, partial [Rheinheimera baltica]
ILTALGLLMASGSTMAAQMECMVDTAAYDQWTAGYCDSFEYTMDNAKNDAIWRIVDTTKPIASIIWSEKTAGCAATATYCTKAIRPYTANKGKATILYTDGTYEIVQAIASFETGF